MTEVVSIANGITLICKNEFVDIRNIYNFDYSYGKGEHKEIRLSEPPILLPYGEQYECLQNPTNWSPSLKTLRPTHIYSRILIRDKMSEIEMQDAMQYLATIYSVRSKISGQSATKLIFQSPQLQSLLMRIFERKTWVDSIIKEALGVNAPSPASRSRIKKSAGAVKPMSTEIKWNRYARKNNFDLYETVMKNLEVQIKQLAFNDLVLDGKYDEAIERYQNFIDLKKKHA